MKRKTILLSLLFVFVSSLALAQESGEAPGANPMWAALLGGIASTGIGTGIAISPLFSECRAYPDFCQSGIAFTGWGMPAASALGIWAGGRAAGGVGGTA